MEKLTHEQKNQMLFLSLVEQMRVQAWISLGKLKNPVTDKIERNLDMAKMTIDMLNMIKDKTTGNLSDEETRILNQAITDLQLNYVDEYEKSKREKQSQGEQKSEAEVESSPEEKRKDENSSSKSRVKKEQKSDDK